MGILHTSGRAAMRGVANGGCMKKETNKKKSGGDQRLPRCHAHAAAPAPAAAAGVQQRLSQMHTLRRGGFSRAPPTARGKYTSATPADGAVLGAERFLVQATCAQHATRE